MFGKNTASKYTSIRLKKSFSFLLATGYIVLSGNVMALRNVFKEPLANSTKGSLDGNFLEPQSTECSSICGSPVESSGGVLKAIEKTLLSSLLFTSTILAPLFLCIKTSPFESISFIPVSSLNS